MELSQLLDKTTVNLAVYLEKVMPLLCNNWWQELVIKALSVPQQRRVNEKGITSLHSLDLAELLRVLSYNWKTISEKMNLAWDDYGYIKEMQKIRNLWAHKTSEGFKLDDIYRHLDTLNRFLKIIEADANLLQEVQIAKNDAIKRMVKQEKAFNTKGKDGSQREDFPIIKREDFPKIKREDFPKINRIRLWASRPHQDNHKIIMAYLELEKKGNVYLDDLRNLCSNINSQFYVKYFDAHYASMKTNAGNSHGKVFHDDCGIILIWEIVREEIREHFGQ